MSTHPYQGTTGAIQLPEQDPLHRLAILDYLYLDQCHTQGMFDPLELYFLPDQAARKPFGFVLLTLQQADDKFRSSRPMNLSLPFQT